MPHNCPICKTEADKRIADSPYIECPACFLWFQSPPPPKLFQAPNEYDLAAMPEHDQQVNRELSRRLFDTLVMPNQRMLKTDDGEIVKEMPRTLDIGCKHPVMAAELGRLGCEAYAIDAVRPVAMTHVRTAEVDFEKKGVSPKVDDPLRGFDLITMIHVFEHMYDPIAALGKLRLMIHDTGRIFLRLPDHRVSGHQRDMTPHHFTIHPYVHCVTSLLEALNRRGNAFVIERTYAMDGYGQRDVILRPITKRPQITCSMIVKDEARDLPRALASLAPLIDHYAIADTGSTDDTLAIAQATLGARAATSVYLGASERDEKGEWRLWDFSAARNYSLQMAEAFGDEWIFWADADDEVITPRAFRRAVYWDEYDLFEAWMDQGLGSNKWIHHRMWRASKRVRFAGRVHEYPVIDGLRVCNISESLIRHHGAPADGQENSNPRNLRILLREWEETPSPRCAFYIAETYSHGGQKQKAVEWYERRIGMAQGYAHERAFAMLYRARVLRELGRHPDADQQSLAGMSDFRDWAEFPMEMANGQYLQGRYADAIEWAMHVPTNGPIPTTPLWREPSMYRDQPARLISWCHEHLGNIAQAVVWSERAASLIGTRDDDWAMRHRRLVAMNESREAPAPAIIKRLRRQIALVRPGAIGDILMTLNLVPALRDANPDADIHYFCAGGVNGIGSPDALGGVMMAAGVDVVMDSGQIDAWAKQYDRVINLVGYPLAEGYPEKPMDRHLLDYFAEEMGIPGHYHPSELTINGGKISDQRYLGPTFGWQFPSLTLPRPSHGSHGERYASLQVRAGWSSYKEWSKERWWNGVAPALAEKGIVVQLIDESVGLTLAQSIALFANARMHLGIDSFTNHLTNYYWTDDRGNGRRVPGVILWGSTQASAAGYPHNTNISKGLECQPCFRETAEWSRMKREPCINIAPSGTHTCMDMITVDEVVAAALKLWEETK